MAEPPSTPATHAEIQIHLRPFTLSDIDHFMVWATDDRVSKFCRWNTYTSKDDGLAYLTTTVLPHPYFRAICLRHTDRPIGAISVEPFTGNDRCRAELGYVLASEYWGRGVATAAVKMVASEIFEEWGHLERMEALVDVENGGSMRVLEKAGFVREGVLRRYCMLKGRRTRDMVMFSMLDSERPKKTQLL